MIKRSYFISVVKSHGDGVMSYSWAYRSFTVTSFLKWPSKKVFEHAMENIEKEMAHIPGENIQVIAFNRV